MRFAGSVKLRPIRLGFLLPPGDIAVLRRVVRLCSCLWGGRYNPIIPFLENPEPRWTEPYRYTQRFDVTRGYIDFFEPDVLVEATEGMAAELGWADVESRFEAPRVVPLDRFYEVDTRGRIQFAAGIDIINVMYHLYDREYKYQRRHKVPFALVEASEETLFFDVLPGAYPDDEELTYIPRAYQDIFEPEVLPHGPEASLKLFTREFAGPLWLSRYDLEESLGRGPSDHTIFIFDPTNSSDVIDYWNYRLVERHVLPISVGWIGEHAALLRQSIEQMHRPIPGNPFGTMFHTDVHFARSIPDQAISNLVREHLAGLPDRSFFVGRDPTIWPATKSRNRWRNSRILVTAEAMPFEEEVAQDGYAKIPAPSPPFHNAAEIYTRARWMNVVSPGVSHRGEEAAIVFPTNLWKPEYPTLGTHRDLTITREGWTIPQQYSIGYSLIRPVGGREAIIGWLNANGVDAHPSEEGQVAAQIIAGAGSLLACGMFADLGTLSLLNGMAESHAERTRDGRRVSATTPARAKHVDHIRRHFDERAGRSFGFWNALGYFLERSVFRAGLRVQCPTCAHYNWFDLDAVGYDPLCSRCLKRFKFGEAPEDLRKVQWFYRVIGPFAAPDYARGGYAVALTLRCIAERHDSEITWSTGLALNDIGCEIDFAAWYRRGSRLDGEREEPVLILGEAKSFGRNAIDANVIANLQRLGERFPGAVLVVSSLKPINEYSSTEIKLLTDLARWGRACMLAGEPQNPLIVLTATELFSEHGIAHAWKALGGRAAKLVQHASIDLTDLYRLAEATQQLYLNLPSFFEELEHAAKLRRERTRLLRLIRSRASVME